MGDVLGPYRITRQLGAGGMGVVFEAVEEGLGRRVALKVLALQLAEEPEFRARFTREATVLARSDSPHIIQVYSHGQQDGCLYLATQFVPGGDLAARVAEEGLPTPDVALDVAAQVASALADAHAVGVIHRDVKPHNVLLRPGQGQVHAYLCDFGIARDDESSLTSSGVVAGTYAYLAPERFRGEPATPASDVYALGCLLWFLLAGRAPYDGGLVQLAHQHEFSPVPQLPGGSEQVNAFLRRAMAKDPAARHPSAAEAAAQLRAIRTSGRLPDRQFVVPPAAAPPSSFPSYPPVSPVPSNPPAPPPYVPAPSTFPIPAPTPVQPDEPLGAPSRRHRPVRVVAVVLAVALLGAGAGLAWQLTRDDDGAVAGPDGEPTDGTSGAAPASRSVDRSVDRSVATGDVDGDGTDDTILLDDLDDTTLVLVSDRRAEDGFGDLVLWSDTAHGSARVVRGDFTGDDRADLALVETDRVRVAASTGSGFAAAQDWAQVSLPRDFKVTAGDFDGDDVDDLAMLTGAGTGAISIEVALSTGSDFTSPEPWAGLDGWTFEDMRVGAADVDGDGRSDFVEMGRPSSGGIDVRVFRSVGDTFEGNQLWLDRPDWDWDATRPLLADVDADGSADLVALRDVDHLQIVVLRSEGGEFVASGDPVELEDLQLGETRSVPADTDGDGATDLVLVDRSTSVVRRLGSDGAGLVETGRRTIEAHVDEDGSILVSSSR
ncbi:hypothetical protein ASE01_10340 [Nocardioides sp. Root190]|nr:hypothetical protein ASE01_10340 [Nocardioides sp. Root190]